MTTLNEQDLPIVNLYGLVELQRLALLQTLADQGIEDPAGYLTENAVEYKSAFKNSVGLAITITKVTRKVVAKPGNV